MKVTHGVHCWKNEMGRERYEHAPHIVSRFCSDFYNVVQAQAGYKVDCIHNINVNTLGSMWGQFVQGRRKWECKQCLLVCVCVCVGSGSSFTRLKATSSLLLASISTRTCVCTRAWADECVGYRVSARRRLLRRLPYVPPVVMQACKHNNRGYTCTCALLAVRLK